MMFMAPITEKFSTDYENFNSAVRGLVEQARIDLTAEGFDADTALYQLELDMLYGGQVHVKRVSVPGLYIESETEMRAIYQAFDALHLGSSFCLRGAGDTRFPALALLVLSWGLFVPLAHTLTFAPGRGWVDGLPQYGLGATGGWIAITAYISLLGITLLLRWRSGAWRRIHL
jgi:hypothetical protein